MMNIGMLWYDNSKTDLQTKILKAVEYYRLKYGEKPNLVFVNQSMLNGRSQIKLDCLPGIKVQASKQVMPEHLWIGMERNGKK